jgi:threonine dehydratase
MWTLEQIEETMPLVHSVVAPTPQFCWPLLSARCGCEVWVKHENHTPIGAFKVRGGVTYIDNLKRRDPDVPGVISATRGNHGQSIAKAATAAGLRSVILVPHGNNPEKNAAMRAFGAELVEHGEDFEAARGRAIEMADELGLHMIPSFHEDLLRGVSTYAYEFFAHERDLDTVYVPIGQGSGICSTIMIRDLFGLKTEVVGVVAENAASYALSFERGEAVSTNSADTIADGMACRVPDPMALEMILKGADRIVRVSEDDIRDAMRAYFVDTHNLAEGAGAAPLAALMRERDRMSGRRVGLILSGGNVDAGLFASIIGEAA